MIEVIIQWRMIPILQRNQVNQHIQKITFQDYCLETFLYCMQEGRKSCHEPMTSPYKGESLFLMYPNTSDNANKNLPN